MPLPSKIVVPAPVPRAALLGAGVSVPQLQPSFCDATASASDGSSSPAGEFARAMSVDAPQSSSSQELQRSRREVTSLRASLDRTNRALRGLRSRLSTRDRELQRAKADKDTLANQVAQQDTLITTLTDELTALRAQVDELRVQLDFLEARRATAARRFSFFEARARRFEYENEGLLVELEGRMQELRFAQDATREAEEDARSARSALDRVRHESSLVVQRLRARLRELTEAHRSRVPGIVYRRLLARANAYVSRFGLFEGLPSEDAGELADDDREDMGGSVSGDDGEVVEVVDADMGDVDD